MNSVERVDAILADECKRIFKDSKHAEAIIQLIKGYHSHIVKLEKSIWSKWLGFMDWWEGFCVGVLVGALYWYFS